MRLCSTCGEPSPQHFCTECKLRLCKSCWTQSHAQTHERVVINAGGSASASSDCSTSSPEQKTAEIPLEAEVVPNSVCRWSNVFKSDDALILDNVMLKNGSDDYCYCLLEPAVRNGLHSWRFRVSALRDRGWIFFGVSSPGHKTESDQPFLDRQTYGINSMQSFYQAGRCAQLPYSSFDSFPYLREGDEVCISLDCSKRTVRISSALFSHAIELLSADVVDWLPHICLFCAESSVSFAGHSSQ